MRRGARLQNGAPVEMPWAEKVQGIVMAYLSGCRGGEALKRILYGEISPAFHHILLTVFTDIMRENTVYIRVIMC